MLTTSSMGTTGPRRPAILAFVWLLVVGLLASCAGSTNAIEEEAEARAATSSTTLLNPQPLTKKPNVLVVMTDDQTVEQMRWLSNVNEFMELGTVYTNSITNYPLCGPSRSTFLTGQYASNHELECNPGLANAFRKRQADSLAPWLQAAGVHTIHVGKYLNGWGGKEQTRYIPDGWDDWRALAGDSAYNYNRFDMVINGEFVRYGRQGESAYSTDVLIDHLDEALRAVPEGEQFFAVFTPLAPHYQGGKNWAVPAERHEDTIDDVLRPDNYDGCQGLRECPVEGSALNQPPMTEEQKAIIDNGYQTASESLLAVDEAFERIVATLEELEHLDDTVVIFTSDNGFFYGEHGQIKGKIHPARESLFVPLAIRGPGFGVGEEEDAPVVNADLAPTILDIFDAEDQATIAIDGQSLLRRIDSDRAIFIQGLKSTAGGYRGVYAGGWLFYEWAEADRNELYAPDDLLQLSTLDENDEWNELETSLQILTAELAECNGPGCVTEWVPPE